MASSLILYSRLNFTILIKYYYIKIYRPFVNGFHSNVLILMLLFKLQLLSSVGRLNVGLSRIIVVDYLDTKCNFLCIILYIFCKGE